jgi:hypothetical protein
LGLIEEVVVGIAVGEGWRETEPAGIVYIVAELQWLLSLEYAHSGCWLPFTLACGLRCHSGWPFTSAAKRTSDGV